MDYTQWRLVTARQGVRDRLSQWFSRENWCNRMFFSHIFVHFRTNARKLTKISGWTNQSRGTPWRVITSRHWLHGSSSGADLDEYTLRRWYPCARWQTCPARRRSRCGGVTDSTILSMAVCVASLPAGSRVPVLSTAPPAPPPPPGPWARPCPWWRRRDVTSPPAWSARRRRARAPPARAPPGTLSPAKAAHTMLHFNWSLTTIELLTKGTHAAMSDPRVEVLTNSKIWRLTPNFDIGTKFN